MNHEQAWKHAIIIPLQKDGNSNDVNNLRPVSLLPLPGKILEKLIQEKLSHYLEFNNILDVKQGGFRPNHSTTDTAVKLTEDIYYAMNNKKATAVVYVDRRKAFDTVNHQILLKKLHKIVIGNNLKKWFQNYLTNRTQSTFANNVYSDVLPLICGVPQGSVLGPNWFLYYLRGCIQNRGLKICLSIKECIRTVILHQQASVPQLFVRRCSNLKKYMFLQQDNPKYRIDRRIVTRAHDVIVLETCIPKIEKYKKRLYVSRYKSVE